MECTPANISLDQDSINAIAAALSDTIQANIKCTMEATITKIVDGVVTGLQSRIIHLEDENTMLNYKKANIDLENRITELERQHDADNQYSKRNFLHISGVS
jgi:hypothetical protein